jgi:hypothetical protein
MAKSFAGGSKVVTSMTKCVSKCFDSLWDGETPESDCLPPYARPVHDVVAPRSLVV